MQPESKTYAEAWKEWSVPGQIIQIKGENILFRPRVSTRPFWLYLADGSRRPEAIGAITLIIQAAIFKCQRLFPRRGETIKVPVLSYHGDELEEVRGRFQRGFDEGGAFILDLGFPVVVDQLESCPDLSRAQVDDILELELIAPTRAHLLW